MLYLKRLIKPPILFVFLSFLFGLSNFIDTSLRVFFRARALAYPLGISLKPLFFVLQAFCLMGFLFQMMSHNQHSAKPKFWGILNLHFAVLATTIILFFVYVAINPGKYGIILYTNLIWLICYVAGLSVTCFWFFSKLLRETRFRKLSIVFLFIGLAFFTNFLNQIYLWPQTLFGFSLPPDFERITRLSPALFMGHALFYTWVHLSIRKNVVISRASIFRFSARMRIGDFVSGIVVAVLGVLILVVGVFGWVTYTSLFFEGVDPLFKMVVGFAFIISIVLAFIISIGFAVPIILGPEWTDAFEREAGEWLTILKRRGVAISSFGKFFAVIIALLLPIIWNNYRNGLINLMIRVIISWGLGYSGYGWYFVSLYLAAFVTYIFLVRHLSKHLDQTIASYLILLGVVSFPWNGLTVLISSYSSIPGNILSIDALIVGFFLRKHHSERKP